MDYLITAYRENKNLLGSDSSRIVRDAKTMVKVNNALKWFKPFQKHDEIRIYSYTNFYDDKTFKLIRTIKI